MPELVVDRENGAVGRDRGTNHMALLARVIGGDKMLAAVLDPLDRAAEPQRRHANQHVLRIKLTPHPEAAADIALMHMDRGGRPPQHEGKKIADAVRHLGGTMQFQNVARGIVTADGTARLDRHAGVAADREIKAHDRIRARHRGIDVAIALAHKSGLGAVTGRELARIGSGVE